MAKLGVNVDHIATLREARKIDYPDPLTAAKIALAEGASCITVHLREDRRHIQDDDVKRIRELEHCRLNLEMAATDEIIEFALKLKPEQVTIVPERREELTTEGGLDVVSRLVFFKEIAKRFSDNDIMLSFFIDPDDAQIDASADTRAVAVEINTARYSEAKTDKEMTKSLRDVQNAVSYAHSLGLTVHAGHGLNYKNVMPIANIPHIDELNIGHSIVSQAIFTGFGQAVSLMSNIIRKSRIKAVGNR